MQTVCITGVSSGIGYAMAHLFLEKKWRVYGIGRTAPRSLQEHEGFTFFKCDLSQTDTIRTALLKPLEGIRFDLVILNAGILGEIKSLYAATLDELKAVMELNLWANKILIDLLTRHAKTDQVVAISSGAAVNGSKGWGGYSLSKAALNMLIKLYAAECENTHFCALAPGVIDTPMVRYILNEVDEDTFPSAKRLKNGPIQTPADAAQRLYETFPKLLAYPSGSFVDVRKM